MDADSGQSGAREEIPQLRPIRRPFNLTALSALGLLILAAGYTLYFASDFLLPIIMAWILALLFKPLVRALARLRIPAVLSALGVLVSVMALFFVCAYFVAGPASTWLRRAPATLERVEGRVRGMLHSADQLTAAAERVQHLAETKAEETPKVEIKKPGVINTIFNQTKEVLVRTAEVFVLLFFFLAAGDGFTLKLIQIVPRFRDKKRVVEITRETEKAISRYLVAMTLVNLYEGVMIGTGLWFLGVPNAELWGFLAFAANYIPYLGALLAMGIITLVALASFDSIGRALIAPAIYFTVNFSDNFISPYIVGRSLVLNPMVVFLSIMFWGWIWGLPGVLLAVPMTMIIKIICDHSPVLAPFAELLTAPRTEKTSTPAVQGELAAENA